MGRGRNTTIRGGCVLIALLMLLPVSASASTQQYLDGSGRIQVVVIADPYSDSRTGPELLQGPEILLNGGLLDLLAEVGCEVVSSTTVRMPTELEREYGEWNRASLTNRTLGRMIYEHDLDECFIIGLLSGSKSLVGMLAGLQHLGPDREPLKDSRGRDILGLPRQGESRPLKVGLVWIDSKGAFNTPDTTIEGDMGGMNVAVAAGLCNMTLRLQAGLDPPLSTKHIVMAGVRDTNPYEELNIDNSFIERISVDEMQARSGVIGQQMRRLSNAVDVIYVHVDLSVLDPAVIPGASLTSGGLSSRELALCLQEMFAWSKAAAIGIAGFPDDAGETSLATAYRLIEAAMAGVRMRGADHEQD